MSFTPSPASALGGRWARGVRDAREGSTPPACLATLRLKFPATGGADGRPPRPTRSGGSCRRSTAHGVVVSTRLDFSPMLPSSNVEAMPAEEMRGATSTATPRERSARTCPNRRRCADVFALFPSRPEIKQEDPLDLSILLSGGKETNKDCPSNGE